MATRLNLKKYIAIDGRWRFVPVLKVAGIRKGSPEAHAACYNQPRVCNSNLITTALNASKNVAAIVPPATPWSTPSRSRGSANRVWKRREISHAILGLAFTQVVAMEVQTMRQITAIGASKLRPDVEG
jgi:hypothetical protein